MVASPDLDHAVHETHISWVYLSGDRAYKRKKPVVLPFLDYGTPQRRHEMCREEVRLNRRLAPDVYLGVRALVDGPGGVELADEDDRRAIDYVVEMRRFDERRSLAAILARGELREEDIAAVAMTLAGFHSRARRVDSAVAPAVTLERRIAGNVHELLTVVEQRGEVERVLGLELFAHAFVVAHAQMLDARARAGWIREGHGDLRAEHVLLQDGCVEIVDCVEFDPGLREIDVAEDLAFLVMDLAARHAEHVGRRLVAAYRDADGEPGEDRLIAFYAAQQALVRAKVGLVRAAQHAAASAEHGRQSAAAREMLAVAERFAWEARRPLAIVVCGAPASGKSHLARALADASGLAHVNSDVTRKHLAGLGPLDCAPDDAYSADFSLRTYFELGRRAAEEVAARGGVIVDATFRRRPDRAAFAEAFGARAPLLFVECRAPAAVLAGRARRRERDRASVSDATLAVVQREIGNWEPLDEVAAPAHLTVRTDRSVVMVMADVVSLLDRRLEQLNPAR